MCVANRTGFTRLTEDSLVLKSDYCSTITVSCFGFEICCAVMFSDLQQYTSYKASLIGVGGLGGTLPHQPKSSLPFATFH